MSDLGRVLVTGASGFVGRYLCPALLAAGADALRASRLHDETPDWSRGLDLEWTTLEVTAPDAVESLIQDYRPDLVIHLAAQSHVPTAFADPAGTWTINTLGTLHVLEALRRHCPRAGLLFVGSGGIYGAGFAPGTLVDEDTPPRPTDPYTASKAAAELLVRQYGGRGLHTVCLRPLNHIGPGQDAGFVVAAFARQIARIEQGLQAPVLEVGNLEAWRDFTDVRDVVAAYVLCGQGVRNSSLPAGSVFNICSGEPHQIQAILDELLALTETQIEVRPDPNRMRPSDTPYAAGDASRLRRATGWRPRIPWRQTLTDILEDWRSRV